jgi:hypothetical protein
LAQAGAGGVAEWSIAPVLKTGKGKPFVSSNLTASANKTTGCYVSPLCGAGRNRQRQAHMDSALNKLNEDGDRLGVACSARRREGITE